MDHGLGALAHSLSSEGTVDVQLIISTGVKIERGPVCVPRQGNVFLVDGNSYSEVNRNWFGHGREGLLPATRLAGNMINYPEYDVGPVFHSRPGPVANYKSRYPLVARVPALGSNWSMKLRGLFSEQEFVPRIDVYGAMPLMPVRDGIILLDGKPE